jgi:hypothetical protein
MSRTENDANQDDQFFDSLEDDDASMNSSGRDTSDEDEEALRIFNASIKNSRQSAELFLEAMMDEDNESG